MTEIERIETLMKEQKISKAKLWKMSKLKKSTFYNIFDPKTNPNKIQLETIRAIANALNTTIDYITNGNINEDIPDPTKTIITKGYEKFEYELNDDELEAVISVIEVINKKN